MGNIPRPLQPECQGLDARSAPRRGLHAGLQCQVASGRSSSPGPAGSQPALPRLPTPHLGLALQDLQSRYNETVRVMLGAFRERLPQLDVEPLLDEVQVRSVRSRWWWCSRGAG